MGLISPRRCCESCLGGARLLALSGPGRWRRRARGRPSRPRRWRDAVSPQSRGDHWAGQGNVRAGRRVVVESLARRCGGADPCACLGDPSDGGGSAARRCGGDGYSDRVAGPPGDWVIRMAGSRLARCRRAVPVAGNCARKRSGPSWGDRPQAVYGDQPAGPGAAGEPFARGAELRACAEGTAHATTFRGRPSKKAMTLSPRP